MTDIGSRFGRFTIVGLIGALLQILLISVLTQYWDFTVIAATPIAVEITVVHNFVWHERFTWSGICPTELRHIVERLWRFHATNGLISLGGNTILMYCLVRRLHTPLLPTAIAAIVLCSLANFLLADRWVFATKSIRINRVHS